MLRKIAFAAAAFLIGKKLYDAANDTGAPDPSMPAGHVPGGVA
jgi:hypothetical protein